MIGEESLTPELVVFPGCDLVGISAKTSTLLEKNKDGYIPATWAKFYAGNLIDKIPNKIDKTIVAVRYAYQEDDHGSFQFFIGCRVTSPVVLPEGLEHLYIPRDDYAKFSSDRGESPQIVYSLWEQIEKLQFTDTGGNRKRSFDFEVYDLRTMNYRDATVDIYVALGPEWNS